MPKAYEINKSESDTKPFVAESSSTNYKAARRHTVFSGARAINNANSFDDDDESNRISGSVKGAKNDSEDATKPDVAKAPKGSLVARRRSVFTANVPPSPVKGNSFIPSSPVKSKINSLVELPETIEDTEPVEHFSDQGATNQNALSRTPAVTISMKEKLKRFEEANAANALQNSMEKNLSERPATSRFARVGAKKSNSSRNMSDPNASKEGIISEAIGKVELDDNPVNTPTTITTIVTTTTTTTTIKKKKKKDGTIVSADVIKTEVEKEEKILSEVISSADTSGTGTPVRSKPFWQSKVVSPVSKDDVKPPFSIQDESLKPVSKSPFRSTVNKVVLKGKETTSEEDANLNDSKRMDSLDQSSRMQKSISSRSLEKDKNSGNANQSTLHQSEHTSLSSNKKVISSDLSQNPWRKTVYNKSEPASKEPNMSKPTISNRRTNDTASKDGSVRANVQADDVKTNVPALVSTASWETLGKKYRYPADGDFWKLQTAHTQSTTGSDSNNHSLTRSVEDPLKKSKNSIKTKDVIAASGLSRNEAKTNTFESNETEKLEAPKTPVKAEPMVKVEIDLSELKEMDISELSPNVQRKQRMRSTDSLSVSNHSYLDIESAAEEWKEKQKTHRKRRPKKDKTKSEAKSETKSEAKKEKKEKVIQIPAINDLKLHKILGEGSFGQVWLASVDESGKHDGSDDKKSKQKTFALKILSKFNLLTNSEIEPTRNEINVLKKVRNQHPCIMNLIAVTQDENLIYLMQEFAQGGELFSLLHSHRNTETGIGGLPEVQACFYSACLADALCFLHSKHKLVFRDLKPENVMLNKYGYPVIIDFGYAKFLDGEHPKTYTLVGTPRYMSPELILSIGYDFGTDNWSLGVMIYELLAGFNPFEGPLKGDDDGMDEVELFEIVVDHDYVPLPTEGNFSKEAKDIVAGLLTKEPDLRMGSKDTGEILDHQWFIVNDIDFQSLRRRKLTAPWLPDIEGHLDTRHFENWDHLAANQETSVIKQVYPKITDREQKKFEGIADP